MDRRVIFWIFLFLCGNLCIGAPISNNGFNTETFPIYHYYGTVFLSATVLLFIGLLFGCACCNNRNLRIPKQECNEEELHHSNYSILENRSEFTLFPPCSIIPDHNLWSTQDDKVVFEPLPDVLPRRHIQRPNLRSLRPAHFRGFQDKNSFLRDWLDESTENFPRTQLHYLKELGNGWFGRVVQGEAHDMGIKGAKMPVIVKILREEASPSEHLYFLREVNAFRDLSHPNIINLQGCCLEADPFLLIMEYTQTNLKSFICKHKNDDSLLPDRLLLKMACDIASGLSFMHGNGYVQMDMAAHNCFIDENMNIKIGDYGISYETFKDDYYCFGDVAIPVRWYPPEALCCTATTIETKIINQEANLWSFGVVLWELFQYGELPYSELSDEEVIQAVIIDKRVILDEPMHRFKFTKQLYHIMKQCWKPAEQRLKIAEILSFLFDLSETYIKSVSSPSLEDDHGVVDGKCKGINVTIEMNPILCVPIPAALNGSVFNLSDNCSTSNKLSSFTQHISDDSSGGESTTHCNCDYFPCVLKEKNSSGKLEAEDNIFSISDQEDIQISFPEGKLWYDTVNVNGNNCGVSNLKLWCETKNVMSNFISNIDIPKDKFHDTVEPITDKQGSQNLVEGNNLNTHALCTITKNPDFSDSHCFQGISNNLNISSCKSETKNNSIKELEVKTSPSLFAYKGSKSFNANSNELSNLGDCTSFADLPMDNKPSAHNKNISFMSSTGDFDSLHKNSSMGSTAHAPRQNVELGKIYDFKIIENYFAESSSVECPSYDTELSIGIESKKGGDDCGKYTPGENINGKQNPLSFHVTEEGICSDFSPDVCSSSLMYHTALGRMSDENVEECGSMDTLSRSNEDDTNISSTSYFTVSEVAGENCSKVTEANENCISEVSIDDSNALLEKECFLTDNSECNKCFDNAAFYSESEEGITGANSEICYFDDNMNAKEMNNSVILSSDTIANECHSFQYFVTRCDTSHSLSTKFIESNINPSCDNLDNKVIEPDYKMNVDCHLKQAADNEAIPPVKSELYHKFKKNSLMFEDLDTGQMTSVPSTGSFDYNSENDDVLQIDTDTNEAILVDASESLIGYVPSRSIELLQECSSIMIQAESFVGLPSCKYNNNLKSSAVSSPSLSTVTHFEVEDVVVTDEEFLETKTLPLEDNKHDSGQNHNLSRMDMSETFNTLSEISTTTGELSLDQGFFNISDSSERSLPIILESNEILAGDIYGDNYLKENGMFNKSNCEFSPNQLKASVFSCDSAASSPGREVYTPDFESDSDESSSGTSCTSTSGSFECIHNKFSCINNVALEGECMDEDPVLSKYKEPGMVKIFSKSWDSNATPTRGVLKTPDKKCGQMRKSVSFHEEDPQLVYQYPPPSDSSEEEFLDNDRFSWHVDYTSYADWELQVAEDDDIPEEIIEIEELSPEAGDVINYRSTPLQGLPNPMMYTLTGFTDIDYDLQESAPVSLCSLSSESSEEFDVISEEKEFSINSEIDCSGCSEDSMKNLPMNRIIIEEIDCSKSNSASYAVGSQNIESDQILINKYIAEEALINECDELSVDSKLIGCKSEHVQVDECSLAEENEAEELLARESCFKVEHCSNESVKNKTPDSLNDKILIEKSEVNEEYSKDGSTSAISELMENVLDSKQEKNFCDFFNDENSLGNPEDFFQRDDFLKQQNIRSNHVEDVLLSASQFSENNSMENIVVASNGLQSGTIHSFEKQTSYKIENNSQLKGDDQPVSDIFNNDNVESPDIFSENIEKLTLLNCENKKSTHSINECDKISVDRKFTEYNSEHYHLGGCSLPDAGKIQELLTKGNCFKVESCSKDNVKKEASNCLNDNISIEKSEMCDIHEELSKYESTWKISEVIQETLHSQQAKNVGGNYNFENDIDDFKEFCQKSDLPKQQRVQDNFIMENALLSASESPENNSLENTVLASKGLQNGTIHLFEKQTENYLQPKVGDQLVTDLLNYGNSENCNLCFDGEKSVILVNCERERRHGENKEAFKSEQITYVVSKKSDEFVRADEPVLFEDTGNGNVITYNSKHSDCLDDVEKDLNASQLQVPTIIITDVDDDFTYDEFGLFDAAISGATGDW